jgi:predicted acetyltransferase
MVVGSSGEIDVRAVADDEWSVVAWLWQVFRHDLALVVGGLPYADGRYQARHLDGLPRPDVAGYLAWRPHPNTGEDAPVGFAVVDGLSGERRSIEGFWVAPPVRREGVGRVLALDVLARHPGAWLIGYQHDNVEAVGFWPRVADRAFGPGRWVERRQPIPHRPDAPADHIIETLPALS